MKLETIYQTIFAAVFAFAIISCTDTANKENKSAEEKTDTTMAPKPDMYEMTADHIMIMPDNIIWAETSGGLPPGGQVAVIAGDPTKEGLFIMRAKFPKGYTVKPHFHSVNEHVTVLDGTFSMGMGETFDETKLTELPTGGVMILKGGTRHFGAAKKDCTIEVIGMGPWNITYVNPDDDPRNAKK